MKTYKLLGAAVLAAGFFLVTTTVQAAEKGATMYRVYNKNSGEHFYTKNVAEKNNLVKIGWKDEGIGWYAPDEGDPVYRVYNKNAGDHHYTLSRAERDSLIKVGWKDEGIGWYSPKEENGKTVSLYREYNPNAKAGSHNYTLSYGEHNTLINAGWRDEGVAWYGVATNQPKFEGLEYRGIFGYDVSYDQTSENYDPLDGVKAYDFFGNELKIKVDGTADLKKPGIYKETFIATDSLNQSTVIKRDVTVEKVRNPEINISSSSYLSLNEKIDLLEGVSAVDHYGKEVPVTISGTVDTSKKGTYYIVYSAVDEFGNKTTTKRSFNVE